MVQWRLRLRQIMAGALIPCHVFIDFLSRLVHGSGPVGRSVFMAHVGAATKNGSKEDAVFSA